MNKYDLAILGSGPAGLSAAIYARRGELNTIIIEKSFASGGQIINTYEVDNYPGLPEITGFELATKMKEHSDKFGAKYLNADVTEVKKNGDEIIIVTSEGEISARAVIIASGASHRSLGIPGEENLTGSGVSYCATCDGAFFRGKDVLVAGGGNVAVEDAIFLARGCNKVYVVHRRDELRAEKVLQTKLFELPNVEMVWNANLTNINGDGNVESVDVKFKDGSEKNIKVDGVFIAVGIAPNKIKVDGLNTTEDGYIVADESGITNIPGIFVAGDVRDKSLRQVVTAVSDGANAATSALRYLI
ncbi:MAG: thioredoxin-disulfide reductase [Lachnospiraceae bacterium]|nr:thioredoxin-disulfide reductase [Lachnospiraceae bacterium]